MHVLGTTGFSFHSHGRISHPQKICCNSGKSKLMKSQGVFPDANCLIDVHRVCSNTVDEIF